MSEVPESAPTTDAAAPQGPERTGPSRRTVLRGVGIATVATAGVALTACAGRQPTPPVDYGSTPPAGTVEIPKADVPVGGGVLLQSPYVVTQPTSGDFKAFSKTCPHMGCMVTFVRGQSIVCACHGSEFAITDGHRTLGPATRGLTSVPVVVDGDNLKVG
ncbi:Rieske (2Fe-2S) protein [Granulicoccus phenolivorans]|uniref:Rieske (2Fe-2S) protein n=1 Tax=Granulicoccus phenolivorans TaxID=266854 RepID=UPI00040CC005|nr:Rieske (2Fe-2S) protein [Granulicoccus phenolivorans]